MKWFLLWTIGFISPSDGTPQIMKLQMAYEHPTQEACDKTVAAAEVRFADYFRGVAQLSLDHPVAVKGSCSTEDLRIQGGRL